MKIGIALSGGGAKGAAHIGVLRALEEANVKISCISGTSSGSIVAALYAAGYSTLEMEMAFVSFVKKSKNRFGGKPEEQCLQDCEACRYHVNARKAKSLIDFDTVGALGFLFQSIFFRSSNFKGFVKGDLLRKNIFELLQRKNVTRMVDFKIPIAIPALDLKSMEMVYFSNRSFHSKVMRNTAAADAVTASCAFPGVFRPKKIGAYLLVDGGILDNLPVEILKLLGADYSIGVRLSEMDTYNETRHKNIVHILERSVNILRYKYERLTDWAVDYTINTGIDDVSLLDMGEMCRCISLGYQRTKEALMGNPLKPLLQV